MHPSHRSTIGRPASPADRCPGIPAEPRDPGGERRRLRRSPGVPAAVRGLAAGIVLLGLAAGCRTAPSAEPDPGSGPGPAAAADPGPALGEPAPAVAEAAPPPGADGSASGGATAADRTAAPGDVAPSGGSDFADEPGGEAGVGEAAAVLSPFAGVRVRPGREDGPGTVELDATVVLDEGWLEQVACGPGTREHESLVVPDATPSRIHAALLLAGHRPGRPGRWRWDEAENRAVLVPPRGDRLRIEVRTEPDGPAIPITDWIVSADGRRHPEAPFVFGGSAWLDERTGERYAAGGPPGDDRRLVYVADRSGSIIGLVTFGDEVIGALEVIPDQAAVAAPEWQADPERVPPPGTRVVLRISRWESSPPDAPAAPRR